MAKPYVFVTVTMSVKQSASMAYLLSLLESEDGVEIVSHDEELRRVHVRAPAAKLPRLQWLARHYASSAVFEVKARAGLRLTCRQLPRGCSCRGGSPTLFLCPCSGWVVYGEARSGKVVMKLCRRGLSLDPSLIPPSMCVYDLFDSESLSLIEEAQRCFKGVMEAVRPPH